MKISIITPTYNRYEFLSSTIESILTQKGDFDLEYIIQDGGSCDNLINVVEKWKRIIRSSSFNIGCKSIDFKFFSEKDDGMYDAINMGFAKSSGDVMAWLNSDDMYHPYALQTISQIFQKNNNISWLTGIPNSYNRYGSSSGMDSFPPAYSRKYIIDGCYRLACLNLGFNWIQQESTFWRRCLWEKIGAKVDTKFKYAADFYLWQSFAEHEDLVKVNSFLGGFRVHDDQFTATPQLYSKELPEAALPTVGFKILRSILHRYPYTRRFIFNNRKGFPLLKFMGLKYEDLVGRTVSWSFKDQEWNISTRAII